MAKLLILILFLLSFTYGKSPTVMFILGPPGCGKGTQASLLVSSFPDNFIHFSVGDLLRQHVNENGEYKNIIQERMVKGLLIDADIVLSVISIALDKNDNEKIILLDGFPRSIDNFESWNKKFEKKYDIFSTLYYECPLSTSLDRILSRSRSSGRDDDKEKTIIERFNLFNTTTIPLIEELKNLNLLTTVSCTGYIETVFENTLKTLSKHFSFIRDYLDNKKEL